MAERQGSQSPQPGDLIEVFRPMGYQHWAIFIEDGEVVHVTPPNASPSSSLAVSSQGVTAVVKRQSIQEVTHGNRWGVNNLHDTNCTPRERCIIVREAVSRVGEVLPYSVTSQNCEHFVTELRYGKAVSRQGQRVTLGMNIVGDAVTAGLPYVGAAPTGAVAAAATVYSVISNLYPGFK